MTGDKETIGKRIGRFISLLGLVAAMSAGVVVSQRLSDDSLALLVGLACGVTAMLPTIGLGVLLWRREQQRDLASQNRTGAGQPPVVIVTPQGLPGYGAQLPALADSRSAAWPWMPSNQQRNFTIVGGEE